MGLFSTKTEIYVSGAISRVRPDERILNTTGLVVAGAVLGGGDIGQALTRSAIIGTVGSYKSFWRKTEKKYGLSTGSFSYYSPNEEELALTIRTDTGNAYPVEDDLDFVSLNPMGEDFWVKYHLQETKNYNITTNVLTHSAVDYYLNSYDNQTTKFVIEASRTKYTDTTVTHAYKVFYDVGLTKWRVEDAVTTDIDWYYLPAGATSSTSNTVYNYSDYDTANDPWLLAPLVIGTDYFPCSNSSFEYLCDPVTTPTTDVESVTFDLNEPLPALEEDILDEQTNDGYTTILVPINYWQVGYTYNSRQYYWLGLEEDFPTAMGEEVDLPDDLEPIFGAWAPIVPIRNDFISYKSTDPDPTNYKKSKTLLKQIGLKIDDLIEAIETNNTDPDNPVPNPDLDKIADAYVSMHSKLKATFDSVTGKCTNLDELAYNYAFFDLLDQYGFPAYENTFDPETGSMYSRLVSSVALNVYFPNIYNQRIEWSSISKTTVFEVLDEEYTATITPQITNLWGYNTVHYEIKKRLTADTCSVITVSNFTTQFTVYYGETSSKSYAPEFDNDPDGESQWVIPVSLKLAQEVIHKDLETFFLRATYMGVFSRVVVKTKWYQQGWFEVILIVVAVFTFDFTAIINSLASAGATALDIVGISASLSVASYATLAIVTGILTYAVISYGLTLALDFALKAVGGDEFLETLVKIVYVVVSVMLVESKDIFQNILTGASAYLDTLKAEIELASIELKELSVELEKLVEEVEKLEKIDNIHASKAYALEIINLFRASGSLLTEQEFDRLAALPSTVYAMVHDYVEMSKRLPDPAEMILASDRLIAS